MLNHTGVKSEKYGNINQILFAVEHQVSMSIVVDESVGVSAANGKKIAKAGTILAGSLDDRTTPFTEYTTVSQQTEGQGTVTTTAKTAKDMGVLLHDVDVTAGDDNGTLLIFGFVNTNRLDSTVKAKITDSVKELMPMIKFVAC